MTRVGFYFNASSKAEVARKLCAKAWQAGKQVLIYTRDEALARDIDSGLWTGQQLSFMPHVRCGHPLAKETPILIGSEADELASPDILINLDVESPPFFSRFERLLEVVTPAPADREAGRERFKFYKARGYPLETVDLQATS